MLGSGCCSSPCRITDARNPTKAPTTSLKSLIKGPSTWRARKINAASALMTASASTRPWPPFPRTFTSASKPSIAVATASSFSTKAPAQSKVAPTLTRVATPPVVALNIGIMFLSISSSIWTPTDTKMPSQMTWTRRPSIRTESRTF